MYHKIVLGLMLLVLLMLALTVVTQGDRLEAQGNPTVLLPIPNVINVIVRCDLKDIPHRGMKVFWNVDEYGYYRINGDGPSLPAQYQQNIAGYEHIGYAGDMDITARNLSDNPSRWSNLRLEMYQSLAWPDGSYTRDWIPILNLNPSYLDCTVTVNNPTPLPTPIRTPEFTPAPWMEGSLNLGTKRNNDSQYAVFAGSFGIRVYDLNGQQLAGLRCAVTPVDIQRIPLNSQSAVILSISADHRVLIYRESDGRFGIRLKTDQGDQVVLLDRLA